MEKKKRLFVWSPSNNETWCYCGGPDLDDAMKGAMNLIREDVRQSLDFNREPLQIEFEIREMTDDEVASLPDV